MNLNKRDIARAKEIQRNWKISFRQCLDYVKQNPDAITYLERSRNKLMLHNVESKSF